MVAGEGAVEIGNKWEDEDADGGGAEERKERVERAEEEKPSGKIDSREEGMVEDISATKSVGTTREGNSEDSEVESLKSIAKWTG